MDRADDYGFTRSPFQNQLSRRAFVVGSLAAGFALAVLPVSAETITTDTDGMVAGDVEIPVADGKVPGYRAMPAAGGPFPTVLVVQEIFGVHEHIKDICRRLAKLGYFAVAPALYAREGDVARLSDIQEILKVVAKVPDAQVASDLDATVAWAKSTDKADTARLGIIGFCWGGRQVWLYAAHNPSLKAGVAWYGPLDRPKTEMTPSNPIDLVKEINAPILGLYGGADMNIPVAQIEQMRAALKAAGKPSEIVIYPDAPHGFNADYRSSYRPQAAKDAWVRMQAWFKKYGVA
ncbi:MAG TPA: dienelactone hydrolase family protein [Candidatus Binataceae bacterium]|nr:dienelactone hydrolase family protein [Candidatus Binataceae bacterium]